MKTKQLVPATLALLLVAWVSAPAGAASAADLEKQFLSKIDELLPGMGAQKIEDRQKDQQVFERICFDNSGPDKQTERQALCQAMMQRVGSDVAMPARVWLLRKVETIGRDESLPRLTELLSDPDIQIRDLARRAIANNPAPQSSDILRDALNKAKDSEWKVALINALAWRHDRESVPQLIKLFEKAQKSDPSVARAAIIAIGQNADDKGIEAIAKARKNCGKELACAVNDASLYAAEGLIANGEGKKAGAIYDELNNESAPENVRITAINGIAKAKGADAVPQLLALINGSNERLQITAARAAQRICGENVTKQLAAAVKDANPDAQAVLLEMLGQRGDVTAVGEVSKYLESSNPDVRVAAIGAMRYIGNGNFVEPLAKLAAHSTGAERDAARDSLKWMRGQCVDDAILNQLGKVEDRTNAELVRAGSVRLMKSAFPAMLNYVNDPDETVRTPVIYNIGKLATPEELIKVLKAFSKLEAGQSTDLAKEAIVRICSRISGESERVQPLIKVLPNAEPAVQIVILQALGELKGESALEAIRGCLKSPDAQVKQAASKALASWGPIYITQWVYSGPYEKDGAKYTDLFDAAFPPEDPKADVEWKPLKEQSGREINLEKMAKGDDKCAYLRTQIVSEADQDVVLTFGSDDGVKVWLNGAVVHGNNATRGLAVDQDKVNATLKKGVNTLLVKVTNGAGQWAFACGVQALEGGPASELKFNAK